MPWKKPKENMWNAPGTFKGMEEMTSFKTLDHDFNIHHSVKVPNGESDEKDKEIMKGFGAPIATSGEDLKRIRYH
mgnify:CR=1 FL=1|tara:strand:- start:160 stop:384 length:225 start_codon:yes stop_codon:yes gene_type:complete